MTARLEKKLEQMADASRWISEDEVCKLLGRSKKWLQNKISNKSFPENLYRVTPLGVRVYDKLKLVGEEI